MTRGGEDGDARFHSRKGASKQDERPREAEEMPMLVCKLILCAYILMR